MITVLIPILNEEKNIELMCSSLLSDILLTNIIDEIIFIDDDSQDGSLKKLKKAANNYHKIKFIIRKDKKKDLTKSILLGFKNVKSKYVCVMDGDLQHETKTIINFTNYLKDYDLVIGSRFLDANKLEGLSTIRKKISKAALIFCKIIGINNVTDPLSGFFIIRTSVLKNIETQINTNGYKILLTILYLLKNKIRIKELQINFLKRLNGKSKLNFRVTFEFFLQLCFLLFNSKNDKLEL